VDAGVAQQGHRRRGAGAGCAALCCDLPSDRSLRCALQQTAVPVLRLALRPAAGRCNFQHPCLFFTMYAGASPIKTVLRSKGFMWIANSHTTAFYWSHAGQHFEIRDEGEW